MPTTIQDYGRNSDKYGRIPYYYVFPYRFWVVGHNVPPHDMRTWCKETCEGYYRIETYTHQSSVLDPITGRMKQRVAYVDKVFIEKDVDAVTLRLSFDVSEVTIMRPEKLEKQEKQV